MVGARKDGGWEGGRKRRVGGREQGEGGEGGEGWGREGMREGMMEGMEGGREGGRQGGREGGREAGREAGMMLCRQRASVEEERVEGGREG